MLIPWKPQLLPTRTRPRKLAKTDWPILQNAIDWLRSQNIFTESQIQSIVRKVNIDAGAATSAFIDGIEQRINDAIQEALKEGDSRTAWRDRLKEIVDVSDSEAEAIGRTYTHRAQNAGLREVMDSEAVGEVFPYFLYQATRDNRTRPTHRAMDDKVAHKDSPLAAQMQALIEEWNCRCTLVPLTKEDAKTLGIDDNRGAPPEPKAEPEPQEEPKPRKETPEPIPTVVPRFEISIKSKVAESFKTEVETTYQALPTPIQDAITNAGFKVQVAQRPSDIDPKSLPRGYEEGMTLDYAGGWVNRKDRTINIVEEYKESITGNFVANSRVVGTARHEIGHAFDFSGITKSQSPEFKQAYAADVAELKTQQDWMALLAYYLQEHGAGEQEVFAEGFAWLHGGGVNRYMPHYFKRSIEVVRRFVAGEL